MRVLVNRWFARYMRRERISRSRVCDAVKRAERGLVDAHLGSGVIKQRIARPGQGRSSGCRAILAYRSGMMAAFILGFAKNETDNLAESELSAIRMAATDLLALQPTAIDLVVKRGDLMEIDCSGPDPQK